MKPRLLDVFCGGGGCSMGYHRAGFDVQTGVDIAEQKDYPFDFVQADALEYLAKYGHEYDFIHASPPCQEFSQMKHITQKDYVNLIPTTRQLLKELGVPYVIENVKQAPLENWVLLRGDMFAGLKVKRERKFECSFKIELPATPTKPLNIPAATKGASPTTGFVSIVGTGGLGGGLGIAYKQMAMGIDWMGSDIISQAIPPAYTQYIGAEWLKQNGFAYEYPRLNVPIQFSLF